MRLHRHDEIVELVSRALCLSCGQEPDDIAPGSEEFGALLNWQMFRDKGSAIIEKNWQPERGFPVSEETPPPLNTEVLAFHERGQNWHQVRWDGRAWVMRWDSSFRQFFLDYTNWMPLPPPLEPKP